MSIFFGCECSEPDGIDQSELVAKLSTVLEVIRPKPWPDSFLRIGGIHDGAYLVPDDLEAVGTCFSPGVNNFKTFEDELVKKYNIACHMCDYSSDESKLTTPLVSGMQTFDKLWLEPKDGVNSISLSSWIKKYHKQNICDLMLQMDIEGAEYRNILSADIDTLKQFRILVMELHGLSELNTSAVLNSVFFNFFTKIGSVFTCVHIHPNNYSTPVTLEYSEANIFDVVEVTFVRSDVFEGRQNDQTIIKSALVPNPLDVNNNAHAAPAVLNEYWCGGTRPLESKLKILEDEFSYQLSEFRRTINTMKLNIGEALKAAIVGTSLECFAISEDEAEAQAKVATLEEVAFGRLFEMSSGFPKRGNVVKSNTDYFFHSDLGVNESITVDLEKTFTVEAIIIVNRKDSCFDRASILGFSFKGEKDTSFGSEFHVAMPTDFTDGTRRHAIVIVPPNLARFVRLRALNYTWFHLSDLRIYASDRLSS